VFDKLFVQNFMPLLTVVARKDAIRKAGVFDPKYRTAEEYDLWLKIAERFPVDFVAQPLAKYRVHDGNFSRNIELSTKEELRIMGFWAGRMRVPSSFVRKRHALIYLRTGWAFYKDREFSKCVRYCLKAIRKRPLSCKAYAVLAFSLIRSGALLKIAGRFGARLSF
jgi:hypothetical protein